MSTEMLASIRSPTESDVDTSTLKVTVTEAPPSRLMFEITRSVLEGVTVAVALPDTVILLRFVVPLGIASAIATVVLVVPAL